MSTSSPEFETDSTATAPLPGVVDWIAAAIAAIVGIAAAGGGFALVTGAREDIVGDIIEQEMIEPEGITQAELTNALVEVAWWAGIGLIIAGVLTVLGAIVYAVLRRRERADSGAYSAVTGGGLGAVVAAIGSFIPLSPLLGGAVSGYITGTPNNRSPVKSGALAGLFALIPIGIIGLFSAIGFSNGFAAVGDGELSGFTAIVIAITSGISLLVGIVLAAIGGYVGNWIRED